MPVQLCPRVTTFTAISIPQTGRKGKALFLSICALHNTGLDCNTEEEQVLEVTSAS